ncbi:MAG: S8/S53 family peptidase, partial [Candidatus Omnitrophota bacterium]
VGFTHGTKMAAVIKGTEDDENSGVAPGADIVDLRIFDDEGNTSSEIIAEAIRYAVDSGCRVLAMPFSLLPVSTPILDAIDYALSQGAILIVAAGNDGAEIGWNSLAAQDGIITVGSVDADGEISPWSNYGSALDLLAPWDVLTLPGEDGEAGTSYSAAFIAGLTALVLSENPDMAAQEVLAELRSLTASFDNRAPEETEEAQEIKGANVDEVLSKQAIQQKNMDEFTGHSLKNEMPLKGAGPEVVK